MRLTGFPLLVASSLVLAFGLTAEARPHYGGTLHVEMQAAPTSLDPAESNQSNWFELRNLSSLMFETLVSLDELGKPEPALSIAWRAESGNQRWRFLLRHGITFQGGTPVTPDSVAASLRRINPTWKVFSDGEAVIVERDSPAPNLPAELALPRNSIVRQESGQIAGTGPFAVSRWDPGKKLLLAAREDYWGVRVFLDAIEIEMGKTFREQAISFDLGNAQVTKVAPEQAHGAADHVRSSAPVELIALVFSHELQPTEDGRQRQALALSIDRALLNTVVLQGGGEPAGGLLPNWMSGYGFLFPASINLEEARQVRGEIPHTALWTLSYDPTDGIARVIAERIVLNARDAGLGMQITSTKTPDVTVVRLPIVSLDPQIALSNLAAGLGISQPRFASGSVEDLYAVENKLLQSQRVIPLLHLRMTYGVSNTVKNWRTAHDGCWRLPNVWLAQGKP